MRLIQSFNILATSTTKKMAITTYLVKTSWSFCSRQEVLSLHACGRFFCSSFPRHERFSSSNSRNENLFLTHCYTKPGIDSNSATNKSPAIEPDPLSAAQQDQATAPPNNQAVTTTCCEGLVFDLGSKTSWDSDEIGSPVVKRYLGDNEERWYMWYHGRDGNSPPADSVGLAVSSNGTHWARGEGDVKSCADAGVVMKCRENWWAFDTESIRPSEMVIMSSPMYSSVYWLYYTGYGSEQVEIPGVSKFCIENPERNHLEDTKNESLMSGKIYRSLPGLACSQDGRHWARIEGDHHSGALLDVGSCKEWDSLFIAKPHVVVHSSDDIRMYYHSFDVEKGEFAIGMARSRDGIRWVKSGKIMGGGSNGCFDELGVKNACVRKNQMEGNYLMAYEGVGQDGKKSIGLAVSPDGLKNWKRIREEAALQASKGDGWDSNGVGSPCLVRMDEDLDEWRLYYVGFGQGGRTGIGMAVSRGSDLNIFKRWSGFHS